MLKGKFASLRSPRKRCTRCEYEWFLRADITRGKGRTGEGRGKIINVELVDPLNCPNPKCKSPYWRLKKKLYPKNR